MNSYPCLAARPILGQDRPMASRPILGQDRPACGPQSLVGRAAHLVKASSGRGSLEELVGETKLYSFLDSPSTMPELQKFSYNLSHPGPCTSEAVTAV